MVSKSLRDNLTAALELLGSAMVALEAIETPTDHVQQAIRSMDEAIRQLRIERSYPSAP